VPVLKTVGNFLGCRCQSSKAFLGKNAQQKRTLAAPNLGSETKNGWLITEKAPKKMWWFLFRAKFFLGGKDLKADLILRSKA